MAHTKDPADLDEGATDVCSADNPTREPRYFTMCETRKGAYKLLTDLPTKSFAKWLSAYQTVGVVNFVQSIPWHDT